jgi:hypothetical protein
MKHPLRSLAELVFVAGPLLVSSASQADQLVVNGGFETGDLTGWTAPDIGSFPWQEETQVNGITSAFEGLWFASTGCLDLTCELSQILSTTPGTSYELSFAFNPGINVEQSGGLTQVFWGGALLDQFVGGAVGWGTHNYTVFANSNATQLSFLGQQNPAFNGLDAVGVSTVVAPVPLPAALPLFAGGLGLLGWMARRKKTRLLEA